MWGCNLGRILTEKECVNHVICRVWCVQVSRAWSFKRMRCSCQILLVLDLWKIISTSWSADHIVESHRLTAACGSPVCGRFACAKIRTLKVMTRRYPAAGNQRQHGLWTLRTCRGLASTCGNPCFVCFCFLIFFF